MCLIIHKPANIKVPSDVLTGALSLNEDGYGLMYSENNQLVIEKSLDPQWLVARLSELQDLELVIHFRMRTSGNIDLDNAHPFRVSEEIGVVHNGVMPDYNYSNIASDTNAFVQDVLTPMLAHNPGIYGHLGIEYMLEDHIGIDNKMVLMNAQGQVWILNKKQGLNYNGVWLSNTYAWKVETKKEKKATNKKSSVDNYEKLWQKVNENATSADPSDWENDDCIVDYSGDWNGDKPRYAPSDKITAEELFYLDWDDLYDLCEAAPDEVADAIILRSHNVYFAQHLPATDGDNNADTTN